MEGGFAGMERDGRKLAYCLRFEVPFSCSAYFVSFFVNEMVSVDVLVGGPTSGHRRLGGRPGSRCPLTWLPGLVPSYHPKLREVFTKKQEAALNGFGCFCRCLLVQLPTFANLSLHPIQVRVST